jgi:glutathione S-transferase
LLAPTERTLSAQPFLFGEKPTLADAALYGQFAMLHAGDPALLRRFGATPGSTFGSTFGSWIGRFEKQAPGDVRISR